MMSFSFRRWLAGLACAQAFVLSCWHYPDPHSTGTGTGEVGLDSTAQATITSGTTGINSSGSSGDDGDLPPSCDTHICSAHGNCTMQDGFPVCVCDPHYLLAPDGKTCVVDESCVKFRLLENRCRQYYNGPPGVGLFFSVDFCAGTAVTPDKLEEMKERDGNQFQVLEDGVNILENNESSSLLVPTDVESYVAIVLDVSKSVIGDVTDGTPPNVDLPALVGELRELVASLEPKKGEAEVAVTIIVFARGVAEYVPFTQDFKKLDRKLAAIHQDGSSFVPDSVSIYGSELYSAVLDGLHSTQRIRDLRAAVSLDGILTTGTVVTITDGADQSGLPASTVTGEISRSLNQVISIGVSSDIDANTLTQLGRDGSYLAPTAEDWAPAFAEVRERVKNYPKRAYLLTYCSARTNGDQEVAISLGGSSDVQLEVTGAGCVYSADDFSRDPGAADECNAELFTTACDERACGGLTACGGCSDDQCCTADGICSNPTTIDKCDGQNELCNATGEICRSGDPEDDRELGCRPPLEAGDTCYGSSCTPGESFCPADASASSPGICQDVYPEGDVGRCKRGIECATQSCMKINVASSKNPRLCRPEAELYDYCSAGGGSAVCEFGGYCSSSNCAPRKRKLERCSSGRECRSGRCETNESGRRECTPVWDCFWPWEDKIDLD